MLVLLVGLCGGLGAACRFVLDGELRLRWRSAVAWPTLAINLAGSLLLGVLTGLVLHGGADPALRLVAGTGFCGGFTTFSTAMVEVVRLARTGRAGLALAHLVGGTLACVAVAAAGCIATA